MMYNIREYLKHSCSYLISTFAFGLILKKRTMIKFPVAAFLRTYSAEAIQSNSFPDILFSNAALELAFQLLVFFFLVYF